MLGEGRGWREAFLRLASYLAWNVVGMLREIHRQSGYMLCVFTY